MVCISEKGEFSAPLWSFIILSKLIVYGAAHISLEKKLKDQSGESLLFYTIKGIFLVFRRFFQPPYIVSAALIMKFNTCV